MEILVDYTRDFIIISADREKEVLLLIPTMSVFFYKKTASIWAAFFILLELS